MQLRATANIELNIKRGLRASKLVECIETSCGRPSEPEIDENIATDVTIPTTPLSVAPKTFAINTPEKKTQTALNAADVKYTLPFFSNV